MVDSSEVDRTEPASPRRIAQAMGQGGRPRSRELGFACCLLGSLVAMRLVATPLLQSLHSSVVSGVGEFQLDLARTGLPIYETVRPLWFAIPLMVLPVLFSAAATIAQVGLRFQPQAFVPDLRRFSPQARLEEITSGRSAVHAIAASGKWLFLAFLGGWWIWTDQIPWVAKAGQGDTQIVQVIVIVVHVSIKLAAVMVVIGVLDYGVAWWTHLRSMRMSREELAAELRESEGDPLIRRRRRQIQLDRTESADATRRPQLVLIGRGKIAVSIAIDRGEEMRLLSKSVGSAASRMTIQALRKGVLKIEHAELVREIYRDCRTGDRLPPGVCERVAELMAQYRARQPGGPHVVQAARLPH